MNDPVDDFARGPEVSVITGDSEVLTATKDEILSVLKPFAEGPRAYFKGAPDDRRVTLLCTLGNLRHARDLYLKLGGVL